ncbi:MAG: Stk1 family PASTA domain-containing Ser/Thr kinase [Bacilli bacterium]|nr:Stk1 family PASTA domain-containing Ser/Thr kinase [Bacilli bacterium]
MLSNGQIIGGRYEIVKSIGEGGMANVYLANDKILDRKVAIKVLRGDLANDEKFIRRFQREAQSVANLSHPNIVEVYDVEEEEGQHYIVMEYIEGKTLKQLLQKRGSLTLSEVIDIMLQLTDGLAHAHDAYIIHRDIKPQNIMIQDDGLVKITDFGIAMALNATQLTQTNSVMGSVHYLPPEQANGKSSTIKSDIYSLGILMYELITGSVPFKGDNAVEIALKHLKEKIPSIRRQNPTIPQSVENIVLRATAKNPKNRYDSVKDMNKDLKECLNEDKKNEKKIVFEYPENDIDDTKVITNVKKSKPEIEEPKDLDELKEKKKIEEQNNEEEVIGSMTKKDKYKLPIILAGIFIGLLIIAGIVFVLIGRDEVTDIKVPDVVDLSVEDAIAELKRLGFNYTTEEGYSDTIEKGNVIRTNPVKGSSRKKGSTIVIVESVGSETYELEDFTGKKYYEVKAKLELLGINVLVEKKSVEKPEDYENKEDLIIDQNPKYDKDATEKVRLSKGDTITLYIPDVAATYPDMVGEGWTLSDAEAFAKEYGITLDVTEVESDTEEEGKIIYQSRGTSDPIIKGVSLKIKVAKKKTDPIDNILPNDDNKDNNNNNGNNN